MFTFKKEPRPTGLSAIANPNPDTHIKLKGQNVGKISGPARFKRSNPDKWTIGVTVKNVPTENNPCPWRWVFFKATFDAESEARDWVKRNASTILEKFEVVPY